ncbi:MAG TPA: FAD-binding protein, partial [bacterium]|nr:FAD-binding protein [bacterium]
MSLRTDLKVSLRPNVSLARYSTMQVGGEALYFAEPACEDELVEAMEFAGHEKIPFFILGKGSNVLFPDSGYPGLVITLIHFEDNRIEFDAASPRVNVSSGMHLYRLAMACRNAGLGGAEFLANIPGTVGGALVMNAGFSRFPGQINEIGDIAEEVTVMDFSGKKETLTRR